MTKRYAYLLGVFLGDGSIGSDGRTFCLQAIDKDFIDATAEALESVSSNKVSVKEIPRKTSANNTVYAVYCSDVKLCRRLSDDTDNRLHIPLDLEKWSKDCQNIFVSGLLDSEGYVSISKRRTYNSEEVFDMCIGIGAVDPWLYELHQYLQSRGIKVGKVTREKLKSGKIFLKFSFNKKSFISSGLFFNLKRKQSRIEKYKKLFPGSTTIRRIPKTLLTKEKMSKFAVGRKRNYKGQFVKVVI